MPQFGISHWFKPKMMEAPDEVRERAGRQEVGEYECYVCGTEGDIEIATLSYRFEFPDAAVLAPTWDSPTAYKAVVQEDSVSGSEVSSGESVCDHIIGLRPQHPCALRGAAQLFGARRKPSRL